MRGKVLILLVLGYSILCSARVKDYIFDVKGTVLAGDGTALQDVEVILRLDNPVYEGVNAVDTQRVVTSKGAFIFRCLSHSPSTKYTLTVRKDGYEQQIVSGTAPPDGNFSLRLKKASMDGTQKDKGNNR